MRFEHTKTVSGVWAVVMRQMLRINGYISDPHPNLTHRPDQSGRSPKVVALFSATNFSSYIVELLQIHDSI